jgi:hypothetical protein
MTQSLNPRVELEIREAIEEISQGEWTLSETAAKLLRVGVAIRESGNEPQIEGPFGLPRPFAEISLSDRMTEIRTEVDDELAERLTSEFDNKPNTAAREAIRLGVIAAAEQQFKIKGPEGGPRPFAQISLDETNDSDARDLLDALRTRLSS